MIGRADIEGSKSNGASTKAWLPRPSIGLVKINQGGGGGLTKYPRKVDVIVYTSNMTQRLSHVYSIDTDVIVTSYV